MRNHKTAKLSKYRPRVRVLEAIRTASRDCRVTGNTMAANELLDVSLAVARLLTAADAIIEASKAGMHNMPMEDRDRLRRLMDAVDDAGGAESAGSVA